MFFGNKIIETNVDNNHKKSIPLVVYFATDVVKALSCKQKTFLCSKIIIMFFCLSLNKY